MSPKSLVHGLFAPLVLLAGALSHTPSEAQSSQNPKLRSPSLVRGFYRQAQDRNLAANQTGTFVFLFWNGPSAETDTICILTEKETCDSLGTNCVVDTTFDCRKAWQGYRVRRTVEGITGSRLELFGQWKARDKVVPLCIAEQSPCDIQNFVFTGAGIFFKGFRNNRLPDGRYVFDYPPGNPADADSNARVYVDLAPLPGFRHEYAVTSVDTTFLVNADFMESAIDSSELVYLTPATPPPTNVERVAVVPNPYRESAEWDPSPNQRRMHFINVPSGSTIRIYTAAGELLRTLKHDPNASPGGTTGDVFWDLLNEQGRAVVSGIYIFSVHPPGGRTPKKGHFVIIK